MTDTACKTLSGVPDEELLACFLEAFSDYSVPMKLTLESFRANNAQRGFDPALSVGAFADGRLAGFILNGRGDWRGLPTAYDLGTGIVPARRGAGLGSLLASESLALLRRAGMKQYLLEAIKTNAPALGLYKKKGFVVTRDFSCFRADRAAAAPAAAPAGFELRELAAQDLGAAAALRDWEPSWQNSDAALLRFPGALFRLGAYAGDELAGYGVIKPTGDLAQLAVKKSFRRRGLGSALLAALAASLAPERAALSCLNIESGDAACLAFLDARGFKPIAEQYEMLLSLQ